MLSMVQKLVKLNTPGFGFPGTYPKNLPIMHPAYTKAAFFCSDLLIKA